VPIRVAIDGPASSGKGTVARGVARALGYAHVDTGALYRAVALVARDRAVSWDDGVALGELTARLGLELVPDPSGGRVRVDGVDVTDRLRTAEVGSGASAVARHGPVRAGLLALQRALAAGGGVVMDGRDIGTVVLPDAELKVWLTASSEERARRRTAELVSRGESVRYAVVLADLQARDARDMGRAVAPLRPADDAIRIDTTSIGVEEAVETVLRLAHVRGA
jgi:cytidylate kinase